MCTCAECLCTEKTVQVLGWGFYWKPVTYRHHATWQSQQLKLRIPMMKPDAQQVCWCMCKAILTGWNDMVHCSQYTKGNYQPLTQVHFEGCPKVSHGSRYPWRHARTEQQDLLRKHFPHTPHVLFQIQQCRVIWGIVCVNWHMSRSHLVIGWTEISIYGGVMLYCLFATSY